VSDAEKRPLLVFLNEVAGGRKLLGAVRERTEAGTVSEVIVAAPQNQPTLGARLTDEELYDSARARVEVTMSVLGQFGIDSVGEVLDQSSRLALGDALRAHQPAEVIYSALYGTLFGIARKDLVEWSAELAEKHEAKFTHIPVRVEEDAIRLDLTHVLVVATQTIAAPDLVARLKERAAARPHRYTIVSPRTEGVPEEQVVRDMASTLAELYRADVDATGQLANPDPYEAVRSAIEHYKIDEVLISTFAGQQSRWLEGDLVGRVREITDKPVTHVEVGRTGAPLAATVAEGSEI
jgi:hypothetical protein